MHSRSATDIVEKIKTLKKGIWSCVECANRPKETTKPCESLKREARKIK